MGLVPVLRLALAMSRAYSYAAARDDDREGNDNMSLPSRAAGGVYSYQMPGIRPDTTRTARESEGFKIEPRVSSVTVWAGS